MNMVDDAYHRFFNIQRREKRDAVMTVNNYVVSAPELGKVIQERPQIHKIETTSARYLYAVYIFVAERVAGLSAENRNATSPFNHSFCYLVYINFSPSRNFVLYVAPVKNKDS